MYNKMECILASGVDIERFLQGQLTCDVTTLKKNHWGFSGYCRPDGKLICFLWIYACDNGNYYLCLPTSMIELFLTRIQRFILRDQVSFEYCPNLNFLTTAPSPHQSSNTFLTTIFTDIKDVEIALSAEETSKQSLTPAAWRQARILAGIGQIYPETSERFLPQILRLDQIGGLSLQKGCYVGQEGIARNHYKTTLRKHLVFAEISYLPEPILNSISPNLTLWQEKNKPAGIIIDYTGYGFKDSSYVIQAVIDQQFIDKPLKAFEDGPSFIFHTYN